MSYTMIDSVLADWAAKHGLQLYTRYHESEVRTVFLEGSGGERGQVWVDPPAADETVVVHAAVYRRRGRDNQKTELSTDLSSLEGALEKAYATVEDWLKAA